MLPALNSKRSHHNCIDIEANTCTPPHNHRRKSLPELFVEVPYEIYIGFCFYMMPVYLCVHKYLYVGMTLSILFFLIKATFPVNSCRSLSFIVKVQKGSNCTTREVMSKNVQLIRCSQLYIYLSSKVLNYSENNGYESNEFEKEMGCRTEICNRSMLRRIGYVLPFECKDFWRF